MSWELVPRKFCTVHLRSRGSSTLCSCRVLFTRYTCSSVWYVALVCRLISAELFPSSRVGCPLVLHLGRWRIKAPKRQPDPCTTMGCNKIINYFNKCEIIAVPMGSVCPLTI